MHGRQELVEGRPRVVSCRTGRWAYPHGFEGRGDGRRLRRALPDGGACPWPTVVSPVRIGNSPGDESWRGPPCRLALCVVVGKQHAFRWQAYQGFGVRLGHDAGGGRPPMLNQPMSSPHDEDDVSAVARLAAVGSWFAAACAGVVSPNGRQCRRGNNSEAAAQQQIAALSILSPFLRDARPRDFPAHLVLTP